MLVLPERGEAVIPKFLVPGHYETGMVADVEYSA